MIGGGGDWGEASMTIPPTFKATCWWSEHTARRCQTIKPATTLLYLIHVNKCHFHARVGRQNKVPAEVHGQFPTM